jgi:hypothetical protein
VNKAEVDRLDIRNNYYDSCCDYDCDYDYDYDCDCDCGCMGKLDGNLLGGNQLDDNLLGEMVLVDNWNDDMDLVDILLDCILAVENNLNFPNKQRMLLQMGLGFDCSVIQVSAPLRCPSQFVYYFFPLYCLQGNSDFRD